MSQAGARAGSRGVEEERGLGGLLQDCSGCRQMAGGDNDIISHVAGLLKGERLKVTQDEGEGWRDKMALVLLLDKSFPIAQLCHHGVE